MPFDGGFMIIRSQDRGSIRNFNLISDLVVSKKNKVWEIIACYPYFAQDDCAFASLGEYSTEEKAFKVLDMIQSKHEEKNEWMLVSGKVFQMPQDDEVNTSNQNAV